MRLPQIRNNRACIRPEISRTYTFGRSGVSGGQFFDKYLKTISLNKVPIDWSKIDLSQYTKVSFTNVSLKRERKIMMFTGK